MESLLFDILLDISGTRYNALLCCAREQCFAHINASKPRESMADSWARVYVSYRS